MGDPICTKVVLIDGTTLAELMIDYGLGTKSTAKYEIRRVTWITLPKN